MHGNDLWHNAMIVYTADWNRTDVPSVSVFIMVNTASKSWNFYIKCYAIQYNILLFHVILYEGIFFYRKQNSIYKGFSSTGKCFSCGGRRKAFSLHSLWWVVISILGRYLFILIYCMDTVLVCRWISKPSIWLALWEQFQCSCTLRPSGVQWLHQ